MLRGARPSDPAAWRVQPGGFGLAASTGRLIARMLGAVARHEAEHKAERKAERQQRPRRQATEAGRVGSAERFSPGIGGIEIRTHGRRSVGVDQVMPRSRHGRAGRPGVQSWAGATPTGQLTPVPPIPQ
ncbi:hypothetical protein BLA24_26475 [Streptomyces cinnamoneus]|uniref:Uncharacterized protein n=1 Tax=Streptomyces cinnamoneus TaxID=53446 RepID=A0A2G1XEB2_STRCJ|nr:hypothetical protein BLA24_26475 [Streptomyces cinnamoneus]PPT14708.1 hypothetical protein CYQ11_19165 [Streptomyces cinnamoneus]